MTESDTIRLQRAVNGLRKIAETWQSDRQLKQGDAITFRRIAKDTLSELGIEK